MEVNLADCASRHVTPLKNLSKDIRKEIQKTLLVSLYSPHVAAIAIESFQRYTGKDNVRTILGDHVTDGKRPDVKTLQELPDVP